MDLGWCLSLESKRGYLRIFRMAPPLTERESNSSVGTGRSAVPGSAHLRQPRNQLEPRRGATESSSYRLKHPDTWSPPPGKCGGSGLSSSSVVEPQVGVTTSPLTCIQVHSSSAQRGSAQLFLGQPPIAKGQQCALSRRDGGEEGSYDAPAEVPGLRRGPGRRGHTR